MVKKTIEKKVVTTVYEALDGKEFDNAEECQAYEDLLLVKKEWEDKTFSVEIDGQEWQYYFVYSDEALVTLFNYLDKYEDVHVNHTDMSAIFKNKNKYIGHWVTYSYDRDMTHFNFWLYTIEEREELAIEKLNDLKDELSFYETIRSIGKNVG